MYLMPIIILGTGIIAGFSGIIPAEILNSTDNVIKGMVMLICFVIGLDMGRDKALWNNIRAMGKKAFAIPVAASIGAIIGGIAAGKLAGIPLSIATASAVGGGYYSLTTILVKDLAGPEAATIAFISNMIRELTVMTAMPLMVKFFGRYGAVGVAGATAMDTSLPFIVKSAGKEMAIAAFVSGVLLTVAMPVMVPLCYRIF